MEQTPEAVHVADKAYCSTAGHGPLTRATHSAPEMYRFLGNLKNFGSFLPQISTQLAQVPAASVALAGEHLARAARLAKHMGEELAQAQNAIAGQGDRTAEERSRLSPASS